MIATYHDNKMAEQLKEVARKYRHDKEQMHVEAERVLLRYLREHGAVKTIDTWLKMADGWWYA